MKIIDCFMYYDEDMILIYVLFFRAEIKLFIKCFKKFK